MPGTTKNKPALIAALQNFYEKRAEDGVTPQTFFLWRERKEYGLMLGIPLPCPARTKKSPRRRTW